jgi:transcriptional regulator GlxA family with amidase domain
MNTKLQHIQNWEAMAKQAKWSVKELATLNEVSTRTVYRFLKTRFGINPRLWLTNMRFNQARCYRLADTSLKETASKLGYAHSTNLTRAIRKQANVSK